MIEKKEREKNHPVHCVDKYNVSIMAMVQERNTVLVMMDRICRRTGILMIEKTERKKYHCIYRTNYQVSTQK